MSPLDVLFPIAMFAIPVVGALVCGVLPKQAARLTAVVTSAAVAVLAVACVVLAHGTVFQQSVADMPWLEPYLSEPVFGVLIDPLGSVLLLLAAIIGFLTVLYSTSYVSRRNRDHATEPEEHGRYYFWLLLFVASMVGLAISPNFLQLFIFWEMTTLCSWALISFRRDKSSVRAGLKALIMTHVGGLFLLGAILLLFVETGSFAFDAVAQLGDGIRTTAFIFLMVAAFAKSAQVPLHTWLPDAMAAPTPISAYLHAAAMVKAGVYLVARSAAAGWAMPPVAAYLLGALALASIFVALSFYFVQDDLKRLLAYSTIAQLGYVLVGVAIGALGSIEGFRGGVLHIICHGFSKATLFFCAGSVAYITGSRSISAIQGLARSMPLTATAFFIGVLAVAGVPPFACFWSKIMIFEGAMRVQGAFGLVILVLLLSETLIAFGWMLYIAQRIFLGPRSPVATVNSEPPPAMTVTVIILMIGCLVAPLIGLPLVELIGR